MNLASWFQTSAGASLRVAESRALAVESASLTGQVAVWASILDVSEDWQTQSGMRLNVWHGLGRTKLDSAFGTCVVGQMSSLPYATGAIDALIIQHGLEEAPDMRALINEAARVLRDGGRAIVLLLDPWGRVGARCLLAKISRHPVLEPFAIECRLPLLSTVMRVFRRNGLICEQVSRIDSRHVKARLIVFRKQRMAVDLPAQHEDAREASGLGLVPASRTSEAA